MQMSSPRERATTTSSPSGTRLDRDCNHALEREIYKRLLYTAPSFSSSFDSFSLRLSVVCLNFLLLHANGEGRSSGEKKKRIDDDLQFTRKGRRRRFREHGKPFNLLSIRESMRKWKKEKPKCRLCQLRFSMYTYGDPAIVIHTSYILDMRIGIPGL